MGRTRCRSCPGRASASRACARRRARTSRRSFAALPPEVRAYARRPELLVITKSTSRSTVHRPGFLDYVAVKRFDAAGDVCGEHRFLGLFTHTAYSANPADIPLLRHKTANVVRRVNLPAGRPRREAADQHPRQLSARRALPDLRGRAAAHGDRHPASRRPAALSPLRPPRSVRALRHLPDLRAARALHDRGAAEVAGDPAAGVQRPELRLQRAPVGIVAGARDDHRAHDARRMSRTSTCARSRRGSQPRRAAGTTSSRTRSSTRWARRAAMRCSGNSAAPSPPATARTSRRAARCPTSR